MPYSKFADDLCSQRSRRPSHNSNYKWLIRSLEQLFYCISSSMLKYRLSIYVSMCMLFSKIVHHQTSFYVIMVNVWQCYHAVKDIITALITVTKPTAVSTSCGRLILTAMLSYPCYTYNAYFVNSILKIICCMCNRMWFILQISKIVTLKSTWQMRYIFGSIRLEYTVQCPWVTRMDNREQLFVSWHTSNRHAKSITLFTFTNIAW
jgi:hypothetical protein